MMKIGYLEVVEVKKIRSRSVCQLIVEADISQFKELVQLDETTGVFIPCNIEGAVCGARDLDINIAEIEALMGLTTTQVEGPKPKEEKAPGEKSFPQHMAIDGYFRFPTVWDGLEAAEIYTQDYHYKRVKAMKPLQPFQQRGSGGDVVAHHVRTAANSGTGIKPPHWYCVPLFDSDHRKVHQSGTRELKDWLLEEAIKITERCMREAFKGQLGLTTLTGFTKENLIAAEKKFGYESGYHRLTDEG